MRSSGRGDFCPVHARCVNVSFQEIFCNHSTFMHFYEEYSVQRCDMQRVGWQRLKEAESVNNLEEYSIECFLWNGQCLEKNAR